MTHSTDKKPVTTLPGFKDRAGRVQTWRATDIRRASYDTAVRRALAAIKAAERRHGVTDAQLLADWLNTNKVPAPNSKTWTKSAVLRALHHLRERGLHTGPGPARKAHRQPISLLWPEGRRAIATRKAFARAGDD